MLEVDTETMGRITIAEETGTEYRPLFEIYYADEADAPSPLVAGRTAALAFATELVNCYNERKGPS